MCFYHSAFVEHQDLLASITGFAISANRAGCCLKSRLIETHKSAQKYINPILFVHHMYINQMITMWHHKMHRRKQDLIPLRMCHSWRHFFNKKITDAHETNGGPKTGGSDPVSCIYITRPDSNITLSLIIINFELSARYHRRFYMHSLSTHYNFHNFD